jgi:energy-coupling factor transport system ATP-binding protein
VLKLLKIVKNYLRKGLLKGLMAQISVEDVNFSYDKKVNVLKNVNFSVEKGEYIAIIGHNGSGKSTLARLLNGLLKADSGEIVVDDFVVGEKKTIFEVRKRVGVVFQNPDNQLVASIVEDDVAFGPENLGIAREEIKERIDFALDAVGMQEFRKSTPTRLSGGQKQRIAIAGVLALKPDVLILDESTAMLDPKGRKEVLSVVKKLNKEQSVTVIAITHYMEEVTDADRVLVMDDGEIVMQGTPAQIFAQGEEIKKIGLELPLATYIAQKLASKGVMIGDVLTEQDLVEELCK